MAVAAKEAGGVSSKKVVFCSKVDGFVPRNQDVNL